MRQIKAVIRYNFMGFYKKPKVILTFLLGFILCFLLSSRIMPVIQAYKSPVQMLEPFLWTFGDTTAILLSSVLLLLLFSDLPVLSAITPYYLCRTTKKRWLFGQLFYVAAVSGIYTVFMLGATMILCAKVGYPGNIWSNTAAMLAYSKLGEDLNIPSTVKVMESVTPYGCTAQVILLLFLYILCLSFIVLAGNLLPGKNRGRDDYMNRLHEEFPYYDWDHNKGYPTKKHRAAIAERGTTPYHRMTFNLLGDGQLTLSF